MAARFKDRWPDNLVRFVSILAAVTPSFFLALAAANSGRLCSAYPADNRRLPPNIDFSANLTGLVTVDALLRGRFDVFVEAWRHLLLPSIALMAATMGRSPASRAPR